MNLFTKKSRKSIKEALIPYLYYAEKFGEPKRDLLKDGYSLEDIQEGLRSWGLSEEDIRSKLFRDVSTGDSSKFDKEGNLIRPTISEMIDWSARKVDAYKVTPQELEQLNATEGIEYCNVAFEDYYPPRKWSTISNPSFRTLVLDGWEGPFKGLKLTAPNVENLELYRRVAFLAKEGLYEKKKLKAVTIRAYPRITAQPLLEHPSIELISLDGIKEAELFIPEGSPLRTFKIGEFWPEMSKISSVTIPEDNNLEEVEIGSRIPLAIHSLSHLVKTRKLKLRGLFVFDCEWISKLTNLEHLELIGVKEIMNIDLLAMLPRLKKIDLWKVKKVHSIEKMKGSQLSHAEFGLIDREIIDQFLRTCALTHIAVSYIKKGIDLAQINNIACLESLSIAHCAIKNIDRFANALNLKELVLIGVKESPEFDLFFVKKMPHLQSVYLPSFPNQKKDIINYFLTKDRVNLSFGQLEKVDGNEIEIETLEYYRDIEITQYKRNTSVEYGFRDDFSEMLKVYNNSDAEDVIKKKLKQLKEKRDFDFDSEADSFGVTSASLENIKWLIDFIYAL